jgi:hypothetical protein
MIYLLISMTIIGLGLYFILIARSGSDEHVPHPEEKRS